MPDVPVRYGAAWPPVSMKPMRLVPPVYFLLALGLSFALHRWLPMAPMADTVRAGLTQGVVEEVTRSYLVLGAWAVTSVGVTSVVLGRRG